MSLATRCTACGTVFRVVQDQLKVSEGWVRCGRCEEVFNALSGLFDLDREAPPPWPPHEAATAEPVEQWGPPDGVVPGSVPLPSYPYALAAELDKRPLLVGDDDADAEQPSDFANARFNTDLLDDSVSPSADTVADTVADTRADSRPDAPIDDVQPEVPPLFVRQAERAARWRRPGVRAALSGATLLLAGALVAQAALHFRDGLAAHWPESRPALEALCALAACRIEPLRRVENLAVDSSGLSRLEGGGLYRFSVVLRNRGSTAVMLPAIDLSLTDAQGELVSRRVVTPAELGATQATLGAGGDVTLQALLEAGERRIVGYQVEIFYP